jgi:hypothetical protein
MHHPLLLQLVGMENLNGLYRMEKLQRMVKSIYSLQTVKLMVLLQKIKSSVDVHPQS